MKYNIKFIGALFFYLFLSYKIFGQLLSAPNASYSLSTHYAGTDLQDSIFVFCVPQQNASEIDLYLRSIAQIASPPYSFTWYEYNAETHQFEFSRSDSLHYTDTSYKAIVKNGLYAVEVSREYPDTILREYQQAWVFINDPIVKIDADTSSSNIGPFNLSGYFNSDDINPKQMDVNYFYPDTVKYLISENTEIEVCFNIEHDTVSELGFYLSDPDGETLVELLPAIANWTDITQLDSNILGCDSFDQQCESGSGFVDFCFSTSADNVPCVCELNYPLSGQYAIAGDWSSLYGKNPADENWKVKFFDCNSNNEGVVKDVTLKFTQEVNGEMISYKHELNKKNQDINHSFACNSLTDLFELKMHPVRDDTLKILNPITFIWESQPKMNIDEATTNLQPLISPYPVFETAFSLTITDSFGCIFSDTLFFKPAQSKFEMYDAFNPEKDGVYTLKDYALIRQFNIRIFNRFGQLVFETDDPKIGWEGKKDNKGMLLPSGYYFYIIQAVGWDNAYKVTTTQTQVDQANVSPDQNLKNKKQKPVITQKGYIYLWRDK